ncbi:MAG: L-histidine N(alpha)-methyltransferase, partial [Burkholderiales bacterium]
MNLPLNAPGLPLPTQSPRFINLYQDAVSTSPDQVARQTTQALELDAITRGLLAQPANVSPKYFYDELGSKLFEAITLLEEYYPTRTEAGILDAAMVEIRDELAAHGIRNPCLIDLGAGNCAKAAKLIPSLEPRQYVPVDISVDFLRDAAGQLQNSFPALDIVGVGMDFSAGLVLPPEIQTQNRLFFYPGSSLGNFHPDDALNFLKHIADPQEGNAKALLLGIDLVKDSETLEAAYDDA